jgi:hypothetical protein
MIYIYIYISMPYRSQLNKIWTLNSDFLMPLPKFLHYLLLLLPWQIRPFGLLTFRINFELRIKLAVGRTSWTGDQPCRKAATYTGQHKHRINADIHVSSGIRTNHLSVSVGEDISCFRPCDHCDRPLVHYKGINNNFIYFISLFISII